MYSTADTTDTVQSISAKPRHIAGRHIGSYFSHTSPPHALFHNSVPKEDHIELSFIRPVLEIRRSRLVRLTQDTDTEGPVSVSRWLTVTETSAWYRRLPLAADDTDYADVYRGCPRVSSAVDSTPRAVMETGPCPNQSTTGIAPASAGPRGLPEYRRLRFRHCDA